MTCYNGLANGSSFIPERVIPQFAAPRIPGRSSRDVGRETSVGGLRVPRKIKT